MTEALHMPDNEIQLQAATEHVRNNVIPAMSGRKCVDGRYRQDEDNGKIARPGGDFGYVMALMSVNKTENLQLSPTDCFNMVYNAVIADSEARFGMHTDSHADPDDQPAGPAERNIVIGCGHIAKACSEEHCGLYGIDAQELEELVGVARQRLQEGARIDMTNLHGEHEEQGVIVVESDEKSIDPFDEKRGNMYFVYDKKRDEDYMRDLVRRINHKGLNYDEFKVAADRQLGATLGILAAGKSVFTVNFEKEIPQVSFAYQIPKNK